MKRLGLFALSVVLLAIPMSAAAHGGHGSGGHGQGGHISRGQHHHNGHHFHGHGGVAALPFFWLTAGPVYYYDPLAVYPPGAMIYDPQTGRRRRAEFESRGWRGCFSTSVLVGCKTGVWSLNELAPLPH